MIVGALTNLGTAAVVVRSHSRVLRKGREAAARAETNATRAETSAVAAGAIYAQLIVEPELWGLWSEERGEFVGAPRHKSAGDAYAWLMGTEPGNPRELEIVRACLEHPGQPQYCDGCFDDDEDDDDDGESWSEPTDHVPLPFVAGE